MNDLQEQRLGTIIFVSNGKPQVQFPCDIPVILGWLKIHRWINNGEKMPAVMRCGGIINYPLCNARPNQIWGNNNVNQQRK